MLKNKDKIERKVIFQKAEKIYLEGLNESKLSKEIFNGWLCKELKLSIDSNFLELKKLTNIQLNNLILIITFNTIKL